MAIEIEKKYRLTLDQRERLLRRLRVVGATREGEAFEENILYAGGNLHTRQCVLRLRRIGDAAILTYKERYPSASPIKHQREDETRVQDAAAMAAILDALGYRPALVYEKRRETWHVAGTEVAVDELSFGLFLEIEGDEAAIEAAEELLDLSDVEAEMATYPQLAHAYGQRRGEIIEARFKTGQ
jgi:predicted adenylyl cyclase CyaB